RGFRQAPGADVPPALGLPPPDVCRLRGPHDGPPLFGAGALPDRSTGQDRLSGHQPDDGRNPEQRAGPGSARADPPGQPGRADPPSTRMREKPKVLVVDREGDAARSLIAFLREQDLDVVWARDSESAFHALDDVRIEALCSVLRGPRIDGLAILRRAFERNPEASVVLVGEPEEADAVQVAHLGAADLQAGPVQLERLWAVLRRGLERQRLSRRLMELNETLDERFGLEHIIGRSPAMARVVESIQHVATT